MIIVNHTSNVWDSEYIEMRHWLSRLYDCGGRYCWSTYRKIVFYDDEDAIAFKLRFKL